MALFSSAENFAAQRGKKVSAPFYVFYLPKLPDLVDLEARKVNKSRGKKERVNIKKERGRRTLADRTVGGSGDGGIDCGGSGEVLRFRPIKSPDIKYWVTRSSVWSFAQTAHSFTCSALLASIARSAALIRTRAPLHSFVCMLARFHTHSRARVKVSDLYSAISLFWARVRGWKGGEARRETYIGGLGGVMGEVARVERWRGKGGGSVGKKAFKLGFMSSTFYLFIPRREWWRPPT